MDSVPLCVCFNFGRISGGKEGDGGGLEDIDYILM